MSQQTSQPAIMTRDEKDIAIKEKFFRDRVVKEPKKFCRDRVKLKRKMLVATKKIMSR